jgi:hypothetical protein
MADTTTTLRSRCRTFLWESNGTIDELVAFVIAETGRKADVMLDQSMPLCLYFADDAAREEFIALWHEAKPNSISRKMP